MISIVVGSETLKNNVELTKFEKILLDEMSKIFRINLEILMKEK